MSEANGLPSERSESFEPFMERIHSYVDAAEPGSLAGLFGEAPCSVDTRADGPGSALAVRDAGHASATRCGRWR